MTISDRIFDRLKQLGMTQRTFSEKNRKITGNNKGREEKGDQSEGGKDNGEL